MLFSTILVILVVYLQCVLTLNKGINPGFESIYDIGMNREPFCDSRLLNDYLTNHFFSIKTFKFTLPTGSFWTQIDGWMELVMIEVIILIIVCLFLTKKELIRDCISFVPVYAAVPVSFGIYYFTCIRYGRYEIVMNAIHKKFFFAIIVSVIMIIMCVLCYIKQMKGTDKSKEEFRKQRKGTLIFVGVVITSWAAILPIWFEAYKICREYSVNYGLYGELSHELRADIQNRLLGNYVNSAVDTDDGLYFLDETDAEGNPTYRPMTVKKMDSSGEISIVYSGEYFMNSIGYADGDLYIGTRYVILKLDPETGICKEVISSEEGYRFLDVCVVDNKLYFTECGDSDEEFISTESDYEIPTAYIMVCNIEQGILSSPELFVSDIRMARIYDSIYGKEIEPNVMNTYIAGYGGPTYAGGICRYQMIDGEVYYLESERSQGEDISILHIRNWYSEERGSDARIGDVGGVAVYEGSVYFVQLTTTGFDLCKCAPDGSGIEVIDSYYAGRDCTGGGIYDYQIMIGQGKILVIGNGYLFVDEEADWSRDFEYIEFVTDLK